MISLTTKGYLQESRVMNFSIPKNVKLKTGEYEIVIVINDIPIKKAKKRKLTFSEHNYSFENPSSTFSRADIYA